MPGSDRTEREAEPVIDFMALVNYLTAPPRYFSSRQSGEWQVLNRPDVVCTVVVPRRKLYRDQAERFLRNADIQPQEEIDRLIGTWYRAGLPTEA